MKTAVYTIVSICAAVFLSIAPTQAQQIDFSKVEMRTIPVADGIYMLIGQGGNIGVCIGEDGVFLIDDQFAPLTDKIVAAVRELTDMPIKFLINTHWHSDHTGANENFGQMGVTIIAQDNVYARMSVDQTNPFSGNVIEAAPPDALPVITFNDEITFHMNGYTIHGKRSVRPIRMGMPTFILWKPTCTTWATPTSLKRIRSLFSIAAETFLPW